jgi:carboxypeptidase family protein
MHRFLLAPVLAMALAACGSEAANATATIEGQVLAGPACPVEVAGSPCPPFPWSGDVRATGADGSVHEVATDADGRYALSLPPGSYTIVAVTGSSGPPTAEPQDVSVTEGQTLHLDLQVDTGIR